MSDQNAFGRPGRTPADGPRATFGTRAMAMLIDTAILFVVTGLVWRFVGAILATPVNLVLGLAYYTLCEGGVAGQTVGKKVMHVRVVDYDTGNSIDAGRALFRYIGRLPSWCTCLLGYFWMLWDPKQQTWHDKIASTTVVPVESFPIPGATPESRFGG